MKTKHRRHNLSYRHALVASVAAIALSASASAATVLFSDNFDGSGILDGTTPDITTGAAKWVAASGGATFTNFNADGTFIGGGTSLSARGGSATLAFTPTDGLVYTLDATVSGLAGDTNWIGLGFATGQNNGSNNALNRFINGNVTGRAWMLTSGNNASQSALTDGTATNIAWTTPINDDNGLDMRIVLDTTGGTGNWTTTWFAKRSIDSSYTTIRVATSNFAENITSVGFALSNVGVSGTIESFSLTQVPEPSAALLGGLAGLLLLRRRR